MRLHLISSAQVISRLPHCHTTLTTPCRTHRNLFNRAGLPGVSIWGSTFADATVLRINPSCRALFWKPQPGAMTEERSGRLNLWPKTCTIADPILNHSRIIKYVKPYTEQASQARDRLCAQLEPNTCEAQRLAFSTTVHHLLKRWVVFGSVQPNDIAGLWPLLLFQDRIAQPASRFILRAL